MAINLTGQSIKLIALQRLFSVGHFSQRKRGLGNAAKVSDFFLIATFIKTESGPVAHRLLLA